MPQAIAFLLPAAGTLFAGGTLTIAGISVSTLVTTAALTVGSILIQNALRPGISQPISDVNSTAIKGNIRSPTAAQRVIYGTQRVGGAVFFIENKPPYLYIGLLLSARQLTAINSVYIGTNLVRLNTLGNSFEGVYFDGVTSYLRASYRLGEDDQAIDPLLAEAIPSLDTNFRQRGHATVVLRLHYGTDVEHHQSLWGTGLIPAISIEVDGVAIYDPRDAVQKRDNELTWKFSDNAALIAADFLRSRYGGRLNADQIDWDLVAEAADYCDSLVGLKAGGFQKRWTINGVVELSQRPFDIFQSMLAAFRGRAVQQQGFVWVESSMPKSPTFTVHEGNLAGGFEFQNSRPKKDLLNTVRTRFVAPDREYTLADGPVLVNETYLTEDDEVLEAALPSPLTVEHQRAQRLGFALMEESRIGKNIGCTVKIDRLSIKQQVGNIVTVDLSRFPEANGTYIIAQMGFADDFSTISLTLSEYDGTIDGRWLPSEDELDFSLESLNVE